MSTEEVGRLRVGEPVAMRVLRYQMPGALFSEEIRRGRVERPWDGYQLSVQWSDGTREVLGYHNLPYLLP